MCMGSSEGNDGEDHSGHWTSTGLSLDLGLSPGSYPCASHMTLGKSFNHIEPCFSHV